eukprot:TRINITY_DN54312_c0_g2_i1.p3 TRINITY_DN54312_c0_g2~~TRINITY_DN54312_c0_g2_i1.p3  ORF type:complete len:146 (-),score=7.93 TRINITY_DN54312_c0_g2_i1:47-484(-)
MSLLTSYSLSFFFDGMRKTGFGVATRRFFALLERFLALLDRFLLALRCLEEACEPRDCGRERDVLFWDRLLLWLFWLLREPLRELLCELLVVARCDALRALLLDLFDLLEEERPRLDALRTRFWLPPLMCLGLAWDVGSSLVRIP